MKMRLTPLLLPLLGVLLPAVAVASLPVPPCAGTPRPAPPAPGAPPVVEAWLGSELPPGWQPPACLGWSAADAGYVATAGWLHAPGGDEALAARLGSVSRMAGIRYWSVSDGTWEPLYNDSVPVTGPDGSTPRADYTAAEVVPGADLYVLQDPSDPIGPLVQRMHVVRRTPDLLELDIANVTPGTALMLEVIPAEGLRTRLQLTREDGDVWRYYALTRVIDHLPAMLSPPRASWLNRSVAMYRWVAGIPSDQEPPAAAR